MAPNVYAANGRMVFSVTVAGVIHDLHYAVEQEPNVSFPGGYGIVGSDVGGTPINPQDAADSWWFQFKAIYPSTVAAPAWSLQENFSGVFVPLVGGVCAGGTGSGGAAVLAAVVTLSFKDTNNFHVKLTAPECAVILPYRSTLASDVTVFGDIALDVLSVDVATPSIGGWIRSRANGRVVASRFASGTISKRLRRIRNYL